MDLSPVERETLVILYTHGDNLPKAISDRADRHSKSVSRSLSRLEDRGYVVRKNKYGVWTLTDQGESAAEQLENYGRSEGAGI